MKLHYITNNTSAQSYSKQSHFSYRPFISIFIFIQVLITSTKTFQFLAAQISVNDTTIHQSATYTLTLSRNYAPGLASSTPWNTQLVPSGSSIVIQFPNQFSISQATVSCDMILFQLSPISGYTCSQSSNNLTIANAITTNLALASVIIQLSSIINPFPALTTGSIISYIGNDVSAQASSATVTLTPANFVTCGIQFNPQYVNTTGLMKYTITPKNVLSSSGSLQIQFPASLQWIRDVSASHIIPINGTLSCQNLTSNVQSTLTCIGLSSTQIVTVSGLFLSNTTAAFSFGINNIFSPPTTQSVDQIIITSYDGGFALDTCKTTISNLIPQVLTDLTVQGTGPLVVNKAIGLTFTFTLTDTVTKLDAVEIQFPLGSLVSFNTHFGTFVLSSGTYNSSSGILSLSFSSSAGTTWKGTNIVSTFVSYTVPSSIRPTSSITYRILKNKFKKMQGSTFLTPIANTYTATFSALSNIVNEVTTYTITFLLADKLNSNGYIQITIPNNLVVQSNYSVKLSGSINNSPTFSLSNKIITIKNLNISSAAISANQNISIIIYNLRNPIFVSQISGFSFKTYLTSDPIDQVASGSTTNSIILSPALILQNSVFLTSSSMIAAQSSVSYSIIFKNTNIIPINGIIKIDIPNQIQVSSTISSCGLKISSLSVSTQQPCTKISNSTYQTISINLNVITVDILASSVITITLTQITNPSNTRPTLNIGINTYSSSINNNAQIDTLSIANGVNISMNTASSYNSLSLSRSSFKNSDQASYTFNINHKQVIQNSAFIRIQFPTSNTLYDRNTNLTCTDQNSQALTCNLINSTLSPVILEVQLLSNASLNPSNYSFKIKVNNIKNPISFQPTSVYKITTLTNDKLYLYSTDSSTITSITNTVASSFSLLNYNFSTSVLGASTNLNLSITQLGSASQLAYKIKVNFASSFTLASSIICTTSYFTSQCALNGSQLLITNSPNQLPSSFLISLSGITAPNTVPSDFTTIKSFDNSDFLMSQNLNTIVYLVSCPLPCKTCDSTNNSKCLSCYNISVNSKIFLHLDTCISSCPSQTYQNYVDYNCPACIAPCLQCKNSSSFCTSCNTSSQFKYINQTINSADSSIISSTCVSSCSSKMYADTTQIPNKCIDCVSPCQTCSSSINCTTCVNGYFFYTKNSTCQTNCPSNTTITNTIAKTCDSCSTQCSTCSIAITNCTSCAASAASYNGTCVLQCPSPLVIYNGSCVSCNSSCYTCSITKDNCTSCTNPLPFLYSFTCLSICPDFYYPNAQKQCLSCINANINCKNCSSATVCLICDLGYVLLNGACLNQTPPGYLNISGKAQPCQGDCATCQVTLTNCTSCKTLYLSGNSCIANCPPGFLGIDKLCKQCQSPCITCVDLLTKCTSCQQINNITLYLKTNTFECSQICNDGTFSNNNTYTCDNCTSPCNTCISASTNDCLTCLTGYFYNGQCFTVCLAGFVGINKICYSCQSPCKTCSNLQNNCTSCQPSLYFNSVTYSCDISCPSGLITNPNLMTCDPCASPCLTCQNSTTLCTSCITNYYLYLNQCLTQCPNGMYGISGNCQNCSSSCRTCSSTAFECNSCTPPLILYQTSKSCVTQCPVTHSVIINNVCIKCSSSNCSNCTSSDQCLSCYAPSIHFNNSCFAQCPSGYQYNGTTCITTVQVANNTLTATLSQTSIFPMPFTIIGVVIFVACFMSKLQNKNTYLIGVAHSLFGVLQTLSIAYLFYNYYLLSQEQKDTTIQLLIMVTLGIIGGLNIISLLLQTCLLIMDKKFSLWLSSCCNKNFFFLTTLISSIVNYKFRLIMFTKLFHFFCCRAQLQSVQGFRVFNVMSFLGMGHQGLIIYVCAITLINLKGVINALFFMVLDVLVIAVINIILALAAAKKDDDFFQQQQDGFKMNKLQKLQDDDTMNQSPLKADDHMYYYSSNKKLKKGIGMESHDIINQDQLEDDDLSLSISQNRNQEQIQKRNNIIFDQQNNKSNKSYKNNINNQENINHTQGDNSSNCLNKSRMQQDLMIQSMMEYQSQAIIDGRKIGQYNINQIQDDDLTQYHNNQNNNINKNIVTHNKSKSKLKPQNIHQSPKKKVPAYSNVSQFGTQDGYLGFNKNSNENNANFLFDKEKNKNNKDLEQYKKQVIQKNMAKTHLKNEEQGQNNQNKNQNGDIIQSSAAQLNVKMKNQILQKQRKKKQQLQKQEKQRRQLQLKKKQEQQQRKRIQEQQIIQRQKQRVQKQKQLIQKQKQRIQKEKQQQRQQQRQRILQQLIKKKQEQDIERQKQLLMNKQLIDQDDQLQNQMSDKSNSLVNQFNKQNPLNSNADIIEIRDKNIDQNDILNINKQNQDKNNNQEDDLIQEVSLVKNMKNSPINVDKTQSKIYQDINSNNSQGSWMKSPLNQNKKNAQKNSSNGNISQSLENFDNNEIQHEAIRKGTDLSQIQQQQLIFANKNNSPKKQQSPYKKDNNSQQLPIQSQFKYRKQSDQINQSSNNSNLGAHLIDKSIDSSSDNNRFSDNTVPLDVPINKKYKNNYNQYQNQEQDQQKKEENKTKKNFQFSQVYEPKKQKLQSRKMHQSENIGLQSSQQQDDQEINHHPIKAKKKNQQTLLEIVQQADKNRMMLKKEGDRYFKISNLVKKQDSKAHTMQGFQNNQYSQRDIHNRDQTQRGKHNKKNQRPPRPMTTDKNRFYVAGLNNLGQRTYNRKSGAFPNTQDIRKNSIQQSQPSIYLYQNQKRNKSLHNTPFKKFPSKQMSQLQDMEFRNLGISPSQYDALNQRYVASTVNVQSLLGPGNQVPIKPRVGTSRTNYQQISTGKKSLSKQRGQISQINKKPITPSRLRSRGSQLDQQMGQYYRGDHSRSRSKQKQKMNERSQQRLKQLEKIYLQRLDTPKKRSK